jgi:hypothetical protein
VGQVLVTRGVQGPGARALLLVRATGRLLLLLLFVQQGLLLVEWLQAHLE